jgi:hypothetical protein
MDWVSNMKAIFDSVEDLVRQVVPIPGPHLYPKIQRKKLADSGGDILHLEFHPFTGMNLSCSISNEGKFNFYFEFRTSSWVYSGERTDLHDIISVVFSALLRLHDTSVSFFTFFDGTFVDPKAEVEVGAVFLLPEQSKMSVIPDKDAPEYIKNIVFSAMYFEGLLFRMFGCPCEECAKADGSTTPFVANIPKSDKDKIEALFQPVEHRVTYMTRENPDWYYYRNFKKKVTLIKSEPLVQFLTHLYRNSHVQRLDGVTGTMYVSDGASNLISFATQRSIKSVFRQLEGLKVALIHIPTENRCLTLGKDFVLVSDGRFGLNEFRRDKEKVRARAEKEKRILFPATKIEWMDEIDPDLFEKLIKELLEREEYVLWVRKSGVTNEPDMGRDLIAEIYSEKFGITVPESKTSKKPLKRVAKQVVVQCKAYTRSVNKRDVQDIRDTIEYFAAHGFILVVSSYVTGPLVEHLNNLRNKHNYHIDWWVVAQVGCYPYKRAWTPARIAARRSCANTAWPATASNAISARLAGAPAGPRRARTPTTRRARPKSCAPIRSAPRCGA